MVQILRTLKNWVVIKGISYRPEISVKENTMTSPDSFTYKAIDDIGAESNVATVDVNADKNTNGESNLEDNGKSVSVDSGHEVDITLKAKDQDKDPLQFEIVTPPSEGRLSILIPILVLSPIFQTKTMK